MVIHWNTTPWNGIYNLLNIYMQFVTVRTCKYINILVLQPPSWMSVCPPQRPIGNTRNSFHMFMHMTIHRVLTLLSLFLRNSMMSSNSSPVKCCRRNIRVYSRTVSPQVTDHVHVHTSFIPLGRGSPDSFVITENIVTWRWLYIVQQSRYSHVLKYMYLRTAT